MFRGKTVHLFLSLVFYSNVTVFGQWSAANSGTTNNLNGAYLLDSGISFRSRRCRHDFEKHRCRSDVGAASVRNDKHFARCVFFDE